MRVDFCIQIAQLFANIGCWDRSSRYSSSFSTGFSFKGERSLLSSEFEEFPSSDTTFFALLACYVFLLQRIPKDMCIRMDFYICTILGLRLVAFKSSLIFSEFEFEEFFDVKLHTRSTYFFCVICVLVMFIS